MPTPTEQIRALSDRLRTTGEGGDIVVTQGVAALDETTQAAILAAVQTCNAFNQDNDPHEEHDCAVIQVLGQTALFKIDYYDRTNWGHSPDAADAELTRRVLTIMLAAKY